METSIRHHINSQFKLFKIGHINKDAIITTNTIAYVYNEDHGHVFTCFCVRVYVFVCARRQVGDRVLTGRVCSLYLAFISFCWAKAPLQVAVCYSTIF